MIGGALLIDVLQKMVGYKENKMAFNDVLQQKMMGGNPQAPISNNYSNSGGYDNYNQQM